MRARVFLGFASDSIGQTLFSFILLMAVAKVCSIEQFGVFVFVIALAGVQQVIAAFGTQQLVFGKSAASPLVHRSALWSAVVISSVVSLLLYASTISLLGLVGMGLAATLYALAGLRVLSAVSLPLTQDAQARQRVADYVPHRISTLALGLVAIVVAWLTKADILVFAAIYGLEPLIYSVVLLWGTVKRRRLRRPARPRYRVLFLQATPLAFQSVMVAISYRFDQIYIQFRFGDAAVAQYGAPARVAEIGNLGLGVVVLILGPYIIRELRARNRLSPLLMTGLGSVTVLAIVASLVSLAIGGSVLSLIFGEQYAGGGTILAVYVLSAACVAYQALACQILSSRGETNIQAVAGLVCALVSVIGAVALCEQFGLIGAAWSKVLAYGASVVVMWTRIRRGWPGSRSGNVPMGTDPTVLEVRDDR